MSWIYLLLAGLLEVVWTIGLKYSDGFTKPLPSIITVVTMVVSFGLLSQALKTIPIGTAYGVWTGIGALGAAVMGIVLFHESRDPARIFFICVLLIGIVGLKMVSKSG